MAARQHERVWSTNAMDRYLPSLGEKKKITIPSAKLLTVSYSRATARARFVSTFCTTLDYDTNSSGCNLLQGTFLSLIPSIPLGTNENDHWPRRFSLITARWELSQSAKPSSLHLDDTRSRCDASCADHPSIEYQLWKAWPRACL